VLVVNTANVQYATEQYYLTVQWTTRCSCKSSLHTSLL